MRHEIYQNGFAFLYFSQSFYDKVALENTIAVFREYGELSLSSLGKYYVLRIKPVTGEFSAEEIGQAFKDYLVAEEYQTNLQANGL